MGKRSEARALARYLAADGQHVDQISRAIQLQFRMNEREATRLVLEVVAPPRTFDTFSGPHARRGAQS